MITDQAIQAFVRDWSGEKIDFDGVYPNQCMDLMHQFVWDVLGEKDRSVLAAPSAREVFESFPNVNGSEKFDKIPYSSGFSPQPGDLCFWGKKVGRDGHVDIAVDLCSPFSFRGFDSNWPVGHLPQLVVHGYIGFLGVLRYKQQVIQPDMDQKKEARLSYLEGLFAGLAYRSPVYLLNGEGYMVVKFRSEDQAKTFAGIKDSDPIPYVPVSSINLDLSVNK